MQNIAQDEQNEIGHLKCRVKYGTSQHGEKVPKVAVQLSV